MNKTLPIYILNVSISKYVDVFTESHNNISSDARDITDFSSWLINLTRKTCISVHIPSCWTPIDNAVYSFLNNHHWVEMLRNLFVFPFKFIDLSIEYFTWVHQKGLLSIHRSRYLPLHRSTQSHINTNTFFDPSTSLSFIIRW